MKRFVLPLLFALAFILVACAPAQSNSDQTVPQPAPVSGDDTSVSVELTRSDEQGEVTFKVTPLNLGTPTKTLDFEVVMDTHSVDLSMDLATIATLTTDTGLTVPAFLWEAPRGGHHVEGKLSFPVTKDGKTILDDASKLTLTITDVDAPSRVFEWPIP